MYKALEQWLPAYLTRARRRPPTEGPIDILLCVCDHFEPFQATDKNGALDRLKSWNERFPPLIREFQDADGTSPRHTFFYPIEQYDRDVINELERLCDACDGEVEWNRDTFFGEPSLPVFLDKNTRLQQATEFLFDLTVLAFSLANLTQ